ncbi:unnamed protein product [Allacma fusca]|uniref:Cyclic nucleotide-binding domain-containing protein n=1 Tax=Allacma fusca TaxID=39272 RepID=A0A8J2P939_9HEXA|nr:unnamed protein product [Allacma fusca]
MWKVARYFTYLGNTYYQQIFWFRVVQALIIVFICVHWMACIAFAMACTPADFLTDDDRACRPTSWLSSLYVENLLEHNYPDESLSPNSLASRMGYLVSMYFSISTFSTSGYGDFIPRNRLEMAITIVYVTMGFYLTGYFTGLLTSALACTTRPNVFFQQTLVSIRQFLTIHGLSGVLRDRIIEHYSLQHQYNEGVVLPKKVNDLMYDAPPYLAEDCLYATLHLHLSGIPIFDHVTPTIIIQMAKMMERYVLPPNIFFLRRGDVRRQMYIIYKGSVAFLKEESDEIKLILEETGHFGQRDLLFGEPSHNNIKTLSYCVIYAIDLQSYNIVFARDLELQAAVKTKKNDYADRIRHLNNLYASVGKLYHDKERKPTRIPSWIVFPKPTEERPEPFNDFCDCEEFQLPYEGAWGCFLKLFLMRRTVHPAGTFALCWKLILGFLSLVIITKDFLQIIVFFWAAEVDTFGTVVNFVFFVDMYVSMHWGYYTESNHLVCHPVKTATHYILDGGLVYAFFIELAPYPVILLILKAIGYTFHGDGRLWSAKISFFGKLIRIFRVPIIIRFCHRVFVARTIVLMSLYVVFTVFICTCVANFAIHLACPWYPNSWKPGDDTRLPACTSGSWITQKLKNENINDFSARWIVAMYYVCQVTFIVGYGDMASHHLNESEIYMSLALMIFGFIVMRVIISDITAAAVDSDEIRASFAEQIECLKTVLSREKVHPKLIRTTIQHMKHTWLLSKGLEPQQLLGDLHPALQSDLFSEYIGDAVSRVPIFSGMRDNILRTICTYMKKQYFKRGERIMRRGNLEYEMYIIVDGDVWIAEKNLELRCSLGSGESMGETQMIYGLQRRFSAVAANNVEVFALNSDGFSQILDRYPNLMEDIEKKLHFTKQDLFERKISLIETSLNEMATDKRSHFDAVVLRNSAILRDVVYAREVPGFGEEDEEAVIEPKNFLIAFITSHIISYGTENHGLPFIYFASRTVMKRFYLLLHPRCGFQQYLKICVLAVAILSPALSIFHIFCAPKVGTSGYLFFMKVIAWIFETTYVLFILTRFITPFETVEGEYCTQRKKITFRYVLNVTRFPCDLISTLPIETFEKTLLYTPYRFFNVIRMLRLIHYYRSHNERRGSITETAFRYNLIMSVSSFALMVHLLACIFYGISECDPSLVTSSGQIISNVVCKEGTWTARYIDAFMTGKTKTVENLHSYKWYIRALYWVICTVSTTGFGDITPLTIGEIGFALFCIFCGAFVLSIILSLFTSGIASNAKFYREYTYQVKLLVKYLSTIGLSRERQELVQIWFNSYWQVCRGCSYRKTTQVLPLSLEIEVNLAIYYETIKLIPLFSGLDKRFLRQVAHRLIHYVHLPGSDIRNEGDQGDTLYIVAKGRVAGYVTNSNGHAKLIRWYNRGKCFGRLPAMFYGQTYTKSYRAEVRSEILYLRQKDIYQLAQNFPKFALKLQDYIEDAYNPVLGTSTILTAEKKPRKQMHVRIKAKQKPTKKNQGTSTKDYYRKRKPIILPPRQNRSRPQRPIKKAVMSKSQQQEEDAKLEKHVKDLLDAHVKLRLGEGLPDAIKDTDDSGGTSKKDMKKKQLKLLQTLSKQQN